MPARPGGQSGGEDRRAEDRVAGPMSDRSWTAHFRKSGSQWTVADPAQDTALRKRHDLQGPVDDAFLDSFIFVSPTGSPIAPGTAEWVADEEKHAITEWRRQFRGEAQVRDDKDVTEAEIAASNLVLWGDPGSNKMLARIAPAAGEVDRRGCSGGQGSISRRYPRAHPDLSQSAQSRKSTSC